MRFHNVTHVFTNRLPFDANTDGARTLGSSVYTPGVPDVEQHFQVSTTEALLGLSLFVLGTSFGPMLAAPISESVGEMVAPYIVMKNDGWY